MSKRLLSVLVIMLCAGFLLGCTSDIEKKPIESMTWDTITSGENWKNFSVKVYLMFPNMVDGKDLYVPVKKIKINVDEDIPNKGTALSVDFGLLETTPEFADWFYADWALATIWVSEKEEKPIWEKYLPEQAEVVRAKAEEEFRGRYKKIVPKEDF